MRQQRSDPLGVPIGDIGALDASARGGRVRILDRWLLRRVARAAGYPPVTIALWGGEKVYTPADEEPVGTIEFRDRGALWLAVISPELGFGDAFSSGRIEIKGDLVEVLFRCYRAMEALGPEGGKRSITGRVPRAGRNTTGSSREHIHHHYDLGNDFYRLWLDARMSYTCAYYDTPSLNLEQAQVAKMEHVARKLRLRSGMRVVEAGCGWGALALHMAREHGVRVRAFNISHEQIAWARDQARAEGLDDRVEFVEDDYRNISGRYDAFVSVGMLEHVGPGHYVELGHLVERVLSPTGLALIHSVGRNRPTPPNAWLEQRIFPGSFPPSLREMMAILEPYNFSVLDVENLRLHYARTLEEWLARFDRALDKVRERYDERFVRAWRLYLGGCAAAFKANTLQLFQVVFTHPANNEIPWTRRHIYSARNDPGCQVPGSEVHG